MWRKGRVKRDKSFDPICGIVEPRASEEDLQEAERLIADQKEKLQEKPSSGV